MTKEQIKSEFSKVTSYMDLFKVAQELKDKGADTEIVNRYLTQRRVSLIKKAKSIKNLPVININMNPSQEDILYLSNLEYRSNNNVMEYDGVNIILG